LKKWRYVGTGRQDGLKIRCEQSRESSSLSGATKLKKNKSKIMKNYHIGCGFKIGKSWLNYDSSLLAIIDQIPLLNLILNFNDKKFPKNIKYGNIVKKNLCEDNEADNIFCSHVLEHVSLVDGKKMLKNIYKMLKPGGVFRIVVPSLESRIIRYNKDKDADLFMESLGCVNKNENYNFLRKLRFYFGGSRHRWMFDNKSLHYELKISGFKNIRECEFGDSGISIFDEVEEKDRFIEGGELKASAFHCVK
jgi:SAM-dependent methyltransferase